MPFWITESTWINCQVFDEGFFSTNGRRTWAMWNWWTMLGFLNNSLPLPRCHVASMIRLSSDFAHALGPLIPGGPDLNVGMIYVFIIFIFPFLSVKFRVLNAGDCRYCTSSLSFLLAGAGCYMLLRLLDVSTAMPSKLGSRCLFASRSFPGTAVRRFNNLAGEESTMSLTQTADLRCLALKIASSLHCFHAWCVRIGAAPWLPNRHDTRCPGIQKIQKVCPEVGTYMHGSHKNMSKLVDDIDGMLRNVCFFHWSHPPTMMA